MVQSPKARVAPASFAVLAVGLALFFFFFAVGRPVRLHRSLPRLRSVPRTAPVAGSESPGPVHNPPSSAGLRRSEGMSAPALPCHAIPARRSYTDNAFSTSAAAVASFTLGVFVSLLWKRSSGLLGSSAFLMVSSTADIEDLAASEPVLRAKPVRSSPAAAAGPPPPELQRGLLQAKMLFMHGQGLRAASLYLTGGEAAEGRQHTTLLVNQDRATPTTFFDLGVAPPLCHALGALGYPRPTPIQRTAYPEILKRQDVVVASEAGTGKTLAWVVPVLELLLDALQRGGPRLRVLVMVPNDPLTCQLRDVIQSILSMLPIEHGIVVHCPTPSADPSFQADILVMTPQQTRRHMADIEEDPLDILVLEEADYLLWGGYAVHNMVEEIRGRARFEYRISGRVVQTQTVLVGATFPTRGDVNLGEVIMTRWPVITWVRSRSLHHTLPTLNYRFVMVDATSRLQALLVVLDDAFQLPECRCLVFTNTATSLELVHSMLGRYGIRSAKLNVEVPMGEREQVLSQLITGHVQCLVCSDLAARGLDIPGLTHVVEFEFAQNAVIHLHRMGRVARAGRKGFATSLYDISEAPLVEEIRRANDHGHNLHRAFTRTRGGLVKLATRVRLERELQARVEEELKVADAAHREREEQWLQRVAQLKKEPRPLYIDDIDAELGDPPQATSS
eukprot:EG_transcript_3818